jgi:hypothetical protein
MAERDDIEPGPELSAEPEPEIVVPASEPAGVNWPLTLTIVSLLVWFGFQAFQLMRERSNLILVKSNQDAAVQESQKVQTQFQNVIAKTSELANQGHAGAKMVMEQLQKQGLALAPETKPESTPESKSEPAPQTKSENKPATLPDVKSIK